MKINIIGIDCATDPKNVGLAFASMDDSKLKLLTVTLGSKKKPLAKTIAEWIIKDIPTLLALDAPLGWPSRLGTLLTRHCAGLPMRESANEMFRRRTDRLVREKIGKQPLDVGADRIARTAHAALNLLEELRKITHQPIPLAWSPILKEELSAIEVYPAATLLAHSLKASGYKKPEQEDVRKSIISKLKSHLDLQEHTSILIQNDDALDAAICILAAKDFLIGKSISPADINLAKKEGWIWVKNPS